MAIKAIQIDPVGFAGNVVSTKPRASDGVSVRTPDDFRITHHAYPGNSAWGILLTLRFPLVVACDAPRMDAPCERLV